MTERERKLRLMGNLMAVQLRQCADELEAEGDGPAAAARRLADIWDGLVEGRVRVRDGEDT